MLRRLTLYVVLASVVAWLWWYVPVVAEQSVPPAEAQIVPLQPSKPTTTEGLIAWYAKVNRADPVLAYWVAKCESGFQNIPNSNGKKYGMGVYQFISSTWNNRCEGDVWNVEDNVKCGTKLLGLGEVSHWGTQNTEWGSWKCWSPHVD